MLPRRTSLWPPDALNEYLGSVIELRQAQPLHFAVGEHVLYKRPHGKEQFGVVVGAELDDGATAPRALIIAGHRERLVAVENLVHLEASAAAAAADALHFDVYRVLRRFVELLLKAIDFSAINADYKVGAIVFSEHRGPSCSETGVVLGADAEGNLLLLRPQGVGSIATLPPSEARHASRRDLQQVCYKDASTLREWAGIVKALFIDVWMAASKSPASLSRLVQHIGVGPQATPGASPISRGSSSSSLMHVEGK